MLEQIKALWRQLKDARPGERFEHLHEKAHSTEISPFLRWFLPFLGLIVATAGLIMIPAPGPGTLILLVGLGMVGTESKPLARWLDKVELLMRAARQELLAQWCKSSIWAKAVVEALVTVTAAVTGYVGYHILF